MDENEWLNAKEPMPMLEFLRGKASERKCRLCACACCRRIWRLMPDEMGRKGIKVAERFADGMASEEERRTTFEALILVENATFVGPPYANYPCFSIQWPKSAMMAAIIAVQSHAEGVFDGTGRFVRGAVPAGQKEVNIDRLVGVCNKVAHTTTCEAQRRRETAQGTFSRIWQTVARPVRQAIDDFRGIPGVYLKMLDFELGQQAILVHDIFGNPFRHLLRLSQAVLAWNDGIIPRIAEAIYEERLLPEGTLDNVRLTILADALLDAGCDDEELIAHCRSERPHVRGCWAVDLILGKE
jgi:hypothetical protein